MVPEKTWVSWLGRFLGRPFFFRGFKTRIHGKRWLQKGGMLLVSNHQSNMDGPLVWCAMDRTVHFLAKEEMFKNSVYSYVSHGLGLIPVARGKGDASALDNAVECLRRGRIVGIFPEGTTSRTDKLLRGHTGVARLHLETGAPIVPMAILGTKEAMPRGRHFPKFVPLRLNVAPPLYFRDLMGKQDDFMVTRNTTDRVMEVLDSLRHIRSEGKAYEDEVRTLYARLGLQVE